MTVGIGHRFAEAVGEAARLHAGQERKGTSIPYVAHLLAVAALVLEDGGEEQDAIAAMLHDAAEDAGGERTLASIKDRFGERVEELVRGCSDTTEEPKPEWLERKRGYLEHLSGTQDEGVLRISLSDKLHNARAILLDYREEGEALWKRFRTASRDDQLWYYRSLADVFLERRPGSHADELDRLVRELEQAVRERTPPRGTTG
jgi:(p)ppGpp synthase/HD superfamily hydrolase